MNLFANAKAITITPESVQFLDGYPHVERFSTGVDTDLFSSALYLENGDSRWLIIGHDLLFLDKAQATEIRQRISKQTAIPPERIMVTCTHTHSGPVSRYRFPKSADDIAPPLDEKMMAWMIDRIVTNAVEATKGAQPAEIGHASADSSMVGCNRHHPTGPAHPEVPVMLVRHAETKSPIALMLVVSVHPTILHQDSTLYSADFPGHCRLRIQEVLGNIPVVHHIGAAGNQSPRHITRKNTPEEARRLGRLLAESVLSSTNNMTFTRDVDLRGTNAYVDFNVREFPTVEEAAENERRVFARFDKMRKEGANPADTRTAECDWFGAERMLFMAKLKASGELDENARKNVLPAEIQVVKIGERVFVAWPGEVFVEFALQLRQTFPNAYVITCANGTTQGYLVTQQAMDEGVYEALGSTFKSPESALRLVKTSQELLQSL